MGIYMNNKLSIEKKLEKKKLYEQNKKKEYILHTKLALKNEQINRKMVKTNVKQLDKSNDSYKNSLMSVQSELENEMFRLANTKQELEKEVQQTQSVELKVKEIEEQREKTSKDNVELQTILEDKQYEIINTVEELNNLNAKAHKEYDLLMEKRNEIQSRIKELSELKVPKASDESLDNSNKAVEEFLVNTKHKENVRMKKYDEKKEKV